MIFHYLNRIPIVYDTIFSSKLGKHTVASNFMFSTKKMVSPAKTYQFATPTLTELNVVVFFSFLDDPRNQNIKNLQLYVHAFSIPILFFNSQKIG